jgi:hypothetical protein
MGKALKLPTAQIGKAPKIKLSKEQKIRVNQMLRLENRISVCRDYIRLWSKLFELFADDIHKRQITEQEEKAFFQTVTGLARKHFLFCELMGDLFEGGGPILDVLVSAVALSNIKAMNESTLSKLELDWHALFLDMNVALGRLLRKLPAGIRIDEALAQADALSQDGSKPGAVSKAAGGANGSEKKGLFGRLFSWKKA